MDGVGKLKFWGGKNKDDKTPSNEGHTDGEDNHSASSHENQSLGTSNRSAHDMVSPEGKKKQEDDYGYGGYGNYGGYGEYGYDYGTPYSYGTGTPGQSNEKLKHSAILYQEKYKNMQELYEYAEPPAKLYKVVK
jgi:hypothetical protein